MCVYAPAWCVPPSTDFISYFMVLYIYLALINYFRWFIHYSRNNMLSIKHSCSIVIYFWNKEYIYTQETKFHIQDIFDKPSSNQSQVLLRIHPVNKNNNQSSSKSFGDVWTRVIQETTYINPYDEVHK